MPYDTQLVAALAGAVVGGIVGAGASVGLQHWFNRRRERQAIVYRVKGLRRLLGQFMYSRMSSHAAQRVQELKLARKQGDRQAVLQEAAAARDFSQRMIIEGEKVKRDLIEAIAGIPYAFRMTAEIESAVAKVLANLEVVVSVAAPGSGLDDEALEGWMEAVSKVAKAEVEARVEQPIDALSAQLEPQLR